MEAYIWDTTFTTSRRNLCEGMGLTAPKRPLAGFGSTVVSASRKQQKSIWQAEPIVAEIKNFETESCNSGNRLSIPIADCLFRSVAAVQGIRKESCTSGNRKVRFRLRNLIVCCLVVLAF